MICCIFSTAVPAAAVWAVWHAVGEACVPMVRLLLALCAASLASGESSLSAFGLQPSQDVLLQQLAAAELEATAAIESVGALKQKLRAAKRAAADPAAAAHEASLDATVAELLAKMTVPEKARQLDIWRTADMLVNGKVNMTKAAASWGDLSAGIGVLHDVYPYPQLGNEIMAHLINASRLKIPPIVGGEATHGLQMDDHTIFPSPISLAATWDVDLMKKYGKTVGSEARACGTHITWAPVLGLCREPRWGRCEEMMGEDTHLAAELGRAAITGFTNDQHFNSSKAVGPLMKHYLAYSAPEGGHNTAPAHVGTLYSQMLISY